MSIALVLLGIVGLAWWMASQKHLSIITASLLVVLVGVAFGYPFFKSNIGLSQSRSIASSGQV